MCIGLSTAAITALEMMSLSSSRDVLGPSVRVIVSDGSAEAEQRRDNARARTSKPGPRLAEDAGADADLIIVVLAL